MSRVPFDTTRLDDEAQRIVDNMIDDDTHPYAPYFRQVKDVILGFYSGVQQPLAKRIFDMCRRPKVIPA